MKFITTSWDDGHVLDFKLATLLHKYNLPGTFYIPKENPERAVMTEAEIYELAKKFEIGGHTLHHTRLYNKEKLFLQNEIGGSFQWLQNLLGYAPVSFCFPGGVYTQTSVTAVFDCGYKVARTTELLNTKTTTHRKLMPTTLQMYEHSKFTYIKHLVKRGKAVNLVKFLQAPFENAIQHLAEYYLNTMGDGDCFHLWGHSWEIEEQGLWQKLEDVLKTISNRPDFTYIQNREILPGQFRNS